MMRKIRLALLMLLIGGAAAAQTPAQVFDRKADPRSDALRGGQVIGSAHRVLGRVTDDQQRPLVGVQVRVIWTTLRQDQVLAHAVTDSSGRYSADYSPPSETEPYSIAIGVRSHDGTSELGRSPPKHRPIGTVVVDIVVRQPPAAAARLPPIQARPLPLNQIR
jgi:hypothetical protein